MAISGTVQIMGKMTQNSVREGWPSNGTLHVMGKITQYSVREMYPLVEVSIQITVELLLSKQLMNVRF